MDNYNTMETVGGVAAGWAAYKYLPTLKKPYSRWVFSEFEDVSQVQNNKYYSAAQKAFQKTGLAKQGVEIIDINSSNCDEVIKRTMDKGNKNIDKFIKKIFGIKEIHKTEKKPRPKWKYILFGPSGKEKMQEAFKKISEGKNACFYNCANNVLVNKDKMGFSTFHEIGHAMNANASKLAFGLVAGSHLIAKFGIPALLAAALIKKRNPEVDNRHRNKQHKSNFLKDNIGLITFGCFTPLLIEEGMASVNGTKLAKKVLKSSDLTKLNILHGKAWSTYLVGAILAGVCAQFAVNIKDKLAQPNTNKS